MIFFSHYINRLYCTDEWPVSWCTDSCRSSRCWRRQAWQYQGTHRGQRRRKRLRGKSPPWGECGFGISPPPPPQPLPPPPPKPPPHIVALACSTIFNCFQSLSTIISYFQLFTSIFSHFPPPSTNSNCFWLFQPFQLVSTNVNQFQLFFTFFNCFKPFSIVLHPCYYPHMPTWDAWHTIFCLIFFLFFFFVAVLLSQRSKRSVMSVRNQPNSWDYRTQWTRLPTTFLLTKQKTGLNIKSSTITTITTLITTATNASLTNTNTIITSTTIFTTYTIITTTTTNAALTPTNIIITTTTKLTCRCGHLNTKHLSRDHRSRWKVLMFIKWLQQQHYRHAYLFFLKIVKVPHFSNYISMCFFIRWSPVGKAGVQLFLFYFYFFCIFTGTCRQG